MKLKNILLALTVLFMVTACNMGQNEPENATPINPTQEDSYISFNMSVSTGVLSTKAGASVTGEEAATDAIEDCTLILSNGDAILTVVDVDNSKLTRIGQSNVYTVNHNFLLKIGSVYTLTAVANNTVNMSGFTSLTQVASAVQTMDTENNTWVKLGATSIDLTSYRGWATDEEAINNVMAHQGGSFAADAFKVTVSQLSAKIEFAGLDMSDYSGPEITISDVSFNNLSGSVYTKLTNNSAAAKADLFNEAVDGTFTFPMNNFAKVAVSTYPHNHTDAPISVSLTYTVAGSDAVTKEYIINRPTGENYTNNSGHDYVQSGHIYRLMLKPSADMNNVELEVVCYTLDWKSNEITYNF